MPRRRSPTALVRSFPAQVRDALGTAGVAWTTGTALVFLACCLASFIHLSIAMHQAEVAAERRRAGGVLELTRAGDQLVRRVLAYSDGHTRDERALPALTASWRRFDEQLGQRCGNPDAPVCSDAWRLRDVMAPLMAESPPMLDHAELRALLARHGALTTSGVAVASDLERDLDSILENYQGALLVLAFSILGFVAAGCVLMLMVGRSALERHALYASAREAEALLSETLEALPAGIVVYDSRERLMLYNSTAAAITPVLNRPDAIGRTYAELAVASVEQNGPSQDEGGGPQTVDEWVQRFRSRETQQTRRAADGRWFEWSEKSMPSGRTVGLRADVTHIKELQLASENARQEYQFLVESLADMVFELDVTTGILTFASSAAQELFGVSAAELVGSLPLERVHEGDRELLRDTIRQVLRAADGSERVKQARFRVLHADGSVRYAEARFRNFERNDGKAIVSGVVRDVDEHVRLARRLEQERARLRSIIESSGALVVLTDRDLSVLTVNHEFAAFAGLSEEDAVGRSLVDFFGPPVDAALLERWGTRTWREDELQTAHRTLTLADAAGAERIVELTARPVLNAAGEVRQIVFVGVDDTVRRQTERALFDAERLKSVGAIAATVIHEVNQPLQVISMVAESAIEELEEAARAKESLEPMPVAGRFERILKQVERMTRITGELRAYSRATSAEKPAPFEARAALAGAVDLTREAVRNAGIDLALECDHDLPSVVGHVGRFEQVMINLINNARDALLEQEGRDANPATRRIDVAARTILTSTGTAVRVTVEDNGPGIADHVLPRLFEMFVTTKPRAKGTGLGLAVCRRIVEEMGGSIVATNRPEGGARFTVLLPQAPVSQHTPDTGGEAVASRRLA
ncbi:MAG: PAS domain S-box protein [Reyranella sp.]|nr:MAG: PAS domain S-box protein [Reyranella sp.]